MFISLLAANLANEFMDSQNDDLADEKSLYWDSVWL